MCVCVLHCVLPRDVEIEVGAIFETRIVNLKTGFRIEFEGL